MKKNRWYPLFAATLMVNAALVGRAAAQAVVLEQVSVSASGEQGNERAGYSRISRNGRLVVFTSAAGNLVPADQNYESDAFVKDRGTGEIELVSVSSEGVQANGGCYYPDMSDDGRYVVFASYADNLVPGDTNGTWDVFLRDRVARTTRLLSASALGEPGLGQSISPVITPDGRFVAFTSLAGNLVPNDTNNVEDIFVFDAQSNTLERVSVSSAGAEGDRFSISAALSDDGRFVAFSSAAGTLVAGDTNNSLDTFVRDRQAGTTERVSLTATGQEGFGAYYSASVGPCDISADGRYVTFQSGHYLAGDNFDEDVFVRDRIAGTTELISRSSAGVAGNGQSGAPMISPDGRYVGYNSRATNLVPDDANGIRGDAFIFDRLTGQTAIVSQDATGVQVQEDVAFSHFSADTRVALIYTWAALLPGDVNAWGDIYARTRVLDQDADGYDETTDCDDDAADVHPGATEVCNGRDDNCDAIPDSEDPTLAFQITASAGANGAIAPAGTVSLGCFHDQTYTVTPNTNYRIAGVSVDGAPVGAVSAYTFASVSADHTIEATFAPYAAVTVLTPNGGEILASGSSYVIRWGAPANATRFDIAYSTNNGATYSNIATGRAGYSYTWTVPRPTANMTQCRIRVVGRTASGTAVGTDFSDGTFTVEVVRVLAPNGGEVFQRSAGAQATINWITNATSQTVNRVVLSYSTNAGATWSNIITLTGNPGSYLWTLPAVNSSQYRVRVRVQRNNSVLGSDTSDTDFTVSP